MKINRERLLAASSLGAAALGFGVLVLAGWSLWADDDGEGEARGTAIATLLDQGNSLMTDVARVVRPAMARTEKLAKNANIIDAILRNDLGRQTDACNGAVTEATEIDAFALFDAAGNIAAINTVYASGAPIDRERVDRVLSRNFADRAIIQSCINNETSDSILEFQTGCDITPAFFDSTGLSIAYSVPIFHSTNHEKIGVASSRLRFERLSDLITDREVGGRGGALQFVTDQGGYFSEAVNSGRAAPPIPTDELAGIVAPLTQGGVDSVVTRRGDDYLYLFRLPDFQTLSGGGIQVMLMADGNWLTRESRLSQRIQAAITALVGLLHLFVAALLHLARSSARTRRILEQQKQRLEEEVEQRRRAEQEREAAQSRLIEISRKAGMAEVATGVLHNVGNVLNSVNVSSDLAAERIRSLKVDSLKKAAEVIQDHSGDLGRFFAEDEKGRILPGFLGKLAGQMAEDQEVVLNELRHLTEKVNHIKKIVKAQQVYTRVHSVEESVQMAGLIDAAVEINGSSFNRQSVEIIRRTDAMPDILTDKHKLLQILVNLIRNAFQALADSAGPRKTLWIDLEADDERFRVRIRDNGVGIDQEHLDKVFLHGFTTKKEGSGFGLHASAIAAKQMGGILSVESPGPGRGATFTLELPYPSAEVET